MLVTCCDLSFGLQATKLCCLGTGHGVPAQLHRDYHDCGLGKAPAVTRPPLISGSKAGGEAVIFSWLISVNTCQLNANQQSLFLTFFSDTTKHNINKTTCPRHSK